MKEMLIGSQNPHKQKKLSAIISPHLTPIILPTYPDIDEYGDTFEEIAQNKALEYARSFQKLTISTDGGAVVPSLSKEEWEPLRTRRFGRTDTERIEKLLSLMEHKKDRSVQWFESIAIASPQKVLFSTTAQAMDGELDRQFNPQFYQEGIWLCSITSFPHFDGKNFFELTSDEQEETENSWGVLNDAVSHFLRNRNF